MSYEKVTFCLSHGDKHFWHTGEGGGQTLYFWGSGGNDDVDEDMDVSEANNLVSEASNISAGAKGPEILVNP